jgi:Na+-translocating ferredoxin:NAD+ oxidoreductase subunit B
MTSTLAQRLDALLPQTQCTRCGYDGCRPYAEAMAQGRAQPNRCPPGGEAVIGALADALGVAPLALDAEVGSATPPLVARIEEDACIGCTKCIQACPVDAIVGASKLMHTVIAAWCTGCELCVPPCPVDCIEIVPVPVLPPADDSRARHQARNQRRERARREEAERLAAYE